MWRRAAALDRSDQLQERARCARTGRSADPFERQMECGQRIGLALTQLKHFRASISGANQ